MRVAITGSTGFIGANVRRKLERHDIEVVPVSRLDFDQNLLMQKLKYCDGIVHLAGESIGGIWTKSKRKRIYNSRVVTARILVDCCIALGDKIKFFVTISGVGIYDGIHRHGETSMLFASDFLASVIHDWEAEVRRLQRYDIKTVYIRTGIVLGSDGGILSLLAFPFRHKIGFTILSDKFLPVIHIEDLTEIFYLVVTDKNIEGVVNAVIPEGIHISDFFRLLRNKYKPWFVFKITKSILHFFMGESSMLLTEGQNVVPELLCTVGFQFRYSTVEAALLSIHVKGEKL